MPIKDWITYDEAATILGLARDTVRKYVERGFFRKTKYGSLPLVSAVDVAYYQEHRRPPGNPEFGA